MKKKICLLLTLVISIVMFSGRVEAGNIYVDCAYNCSSVTCGPLVSKNPTDADKFVVLTNETGGIRHYAIEARDGKTYYAWLLENDYKNGGSSNGCWLSQISKGYNRAATCNQNIAYSERSPKDVLLKGICPVCACVQPYSGSADSGNWDMADRIYEQELVPIGESKAERVESIDETVYVVYKFKDNNNNEKIFIEGYLGNDSGKVGAYAFVGPHLDAFWWVDGITEHQLNMLEKFGGDFWKVHEKDETRLIFENMDINGSKNGSLVNVCKGLSASQCTSSHAYEVLIDSNDKYDRNSKLWNLVSDWLDENELENNDSNGGIFNIINNSDLNNTCNDINSAMLDGKSYYFNEGYDNEELVSDLETAYKALFVSHEQKFSYIDYTNPGGKTEVSDSMVTKLYRDVLDVFKLTDLMYVNEDDSNSWKYHINDQHLIDALERDVKYILEEIVYGGNAPDVNVININDYLNDYTLLYFTTVSNLDSNPLIFGLNSDLAKRVSELRTNFEKLVTKYELNMYPIVDCKGLLGQDLIDKINSYLDIIKIIIPIILIGYGIIDFTKAIFGGEDDMKKAQKSFFMRIGIAVIIFITPTIVNLILNLANKVWPIISPNSCGLFE